MRLDEALKYFPPEGQLEMLAQGTFEQQRQAAQICADAVRKIAREQMALLKAILVMRANTVVGSASGYSLIRNADLNEIASLAASLLLRPGSIPLLPAAPPNEST